MHLTLPVLALALASQASAWSAVGHEIVATIAQAHLTPTTLSAVASLLPSTSNGHLAFIAAWADSIRFRYPETGPLHYVNALGDDPAETCSFGEDGWVNGERNLLKAVGNYTRLLKEGKEGDIPLRFLVHFIGDLHQPLHLAGKLRGGNGAVVKFEGRRASLHSLWDGLLIQKSIRELGNYTTKLPSKRIEAALTGKAYDPYVRFIIWEGIRGFWRAPSINEWPSCPTAAYYSQIPGPPDVITGPISLGPDHVDPFASLVTASRAAAVAAALEAGLPPPPPPTPVKALGKPKILPLALSMLGLPGAIIGMLPTRWLEEESVALGQFPEGWERNGELPGCPWKWASDIHPMNCDLVWPKNLTVGMELDTPEYWGKVKGDLVVEKQLAMGGIRLAAVLNSIFDPALQGQLSAAGMHDA